MYRARDPKLARDVAIKILPADVYSARGTARAFPARGPGTCRAEPSPHRSHFYELAEANGLRGLVLEFVEGETPADRLRRGPIPLDDALPIARQIADALEAAHEKAIIHRDLKPGNIKITPDGIVKVLDFGLAKNLSGDGSTPELTNAPVMTHDQMPEWVVMGTAAYMSPEQACGKRLDRRTDIWSFGVVLFEMMTGHRPFGGETTSETLAAVLKTEPEWGQLPAGMASDLRRLIRRCLEKDPKRRLQAIGDARIQIEDLVNGTPDPESLERATDRHSVPASAKGRRIAMALATLALAVAAWSLWPRQQRIVAPSFTRVVRLTHTSATEYGPAISRDGKWVAYLSNARGPMDTGSDSWLAAKRRT